MKYMDNLPAMELMRSEKMMLVQLIIPVESAHRAVAYLGQVGLIQFRDVKRCAEMSRKLRFIKDQIHKAGLVPSPSPASEPDLEIEELEIQLAEHEHGLIEMNANSEKLQQTYTELLEFKIVLQKAGDVLLSSGSHVAAQETELDENAHINADSSDTSSLLELEMQPGSSNQSGVRFISGIICKSKLLSFERMLFRTTRGNMLFNQEPADDKILDPGSNEMVEKTVFVVFFSGEQVRIKILKICEAFGASCYPVPEDTTKRRQLTREDLVYHGSTRLVKIDLRMIVYATHLVIASRLPVTYNNCSVLSHLSELETTLEAGLSHRDKALTSTGCHLSKWMNMVRREKAIYDTLNMLNFDVTKKCLVGEGWCPISAKAKIQEALQRATYHCNSQVGVIFHVMDSVESPPTYFKTNQFTGAYQEIVDAYGVAKYQEANPAVYTIITFPFLFAVMFGDWGHGICLLMGALFLIAREKKFGSQVKSLPSLGF
ncbi:v-type proton ATPase subunit a1 [Phtheirospermum japonicum]|uniref:V-type proton ATPase subunit a n=1 Tax=Phtheirospermum japonicum TaxID=374723 RepID=A0A830C6M3_9LAMI|nr:v-type proton ATPase subunit a1 [Phtheirospermum japonicum]